MVMIMKSWYNFSGILLNKFNDHSYSPSIVYFIHKIYSNSLPFKNVILGDNEKLWIKFFYDKSFIWYELHDTCHKNLT